MSSLVSHMRALSSPTPREKQRLAGGSTHLFSGWLFVETNHKRAFMWRFCVLDGTRFRVFSQQVELRDLASLSGNSVLISDHRLVHVDRMHRLNRGMLLVDNDGSSMWVHGTHDQLYFEQWLAVLEAAVLSQPVRLTISRYGFAHQSSDAEWIDDSGSAYTDWFRIRRKYLRGWVVGPTQRMYCVLSGRHLSAFKLNIEGRWADLSGKITQLQLTRDCKWLEVSLDTGATLHMKAESDGITSMWELRIHAALRHDPRLSARFDHASLPLVKRSHAPRRMVTF